MSGHCKHCGHDSCMCSDEPIAMGFVEALQHFKKEVESSDLYSRFIDGTPLENDISVWMAQAYIDGVYNSRTVNRRKLNKAESNLKLATDALDKARVALDAVGAHVPANDVKEALNQIKKH